MVHQRVVLPTAIVLASLCGPAGAVPVAGKLELPPTPERPKPAVRGFIDRVENTELPVLPYDVGSYLLVVLENDTTRPESGGQVPWELVGESFRWPVLGAPLGAQVVIKNVSTTARTLVALEDPKLLQTGMINPKIGERTFTMANPRVFTITDKDAPHLVGRVVGVATSYIAHVQVSGTTGKFDLGDVVEGTYTLRVFYKDHWLTDTATVTVPAKIRGRGKYEVSAKITSYGKSAESK